jgi:hypothetical protein
MNRTADPPQADSVVQSRLSQHDSLAHKRDHAVRDQFRESPGEFPRVHVPENGDGDPAPPPLPCATSVDDHQNAAVTFVKAQISTAFRLQTVALTTADASSNEGNALLRKSVIPLKDASGHDIKVIDKIKLSRLLQKRLPLSNVWADALAALEKQRFIRCDHHHQHLHVLDAHVLGEDECVRAESALAKHFPVLRDLPPELEMWFAAQHVRSDYATSSAPAQSAISADPFANDARLRYLAAAAAAAGVESEHIKSWLDAAKQMTRVSNGLNVVSLNLNCLTDHCSTIISSTTRRVPFLTHFLAVMDVDIAFLQEVGGGREMCALRAAFSDISDWELFDDDTRENPPWPFCFGLGTAVLVRKRPFIRAEKIAWRNNTQCAKLGALQYTIVQIATRADDDPLVVGSFYFPRCESKKLKRGYKVLVQQCELGETSDDDDGMTSDDDVVTSDGGTRTAQSSKPAGAAAEKKLVLLQKKKREEMLIDDFVKVVATNKVEIGGADFNAYFMPSETRAYCGSTRDRGTLLAGTHDVTVLVPLRNAAQPNSQTKQRGSGDNDVDDGGDHVLDDDNDENDDENNYSNNDDPGDSDDTREFWFHTCLDGLFMCGARIHSIAPSLSRGGTQAISYAMSDHSAVLGQIAVPSAFADAFRRRHAVQSPRRQGFHKLEPGDESEQILTAFGGASQRIFSDSTDRLCRMHPSQIERYIRTGLQQAAKQAGVPFGSSAHWSNRTNSDVPASTAAVSGAAAAAESEPRAASGHEPRLYGSGAVGEPARVVRMQGVVRFALPSTAKELGDELVAVSDWTSNSRNVLSTFEHSSTFELQQSISSKRSFRRYFDEMITPFTQYEIARRSLQSAAGASAAAETQRAEAGATLETTEKQAVATMKLQEEGLNRVRGLILLRLEKVDLPAEAARIQHGDATPGEKMQDLVRLLDTKACRQDGLAGGSSNSAGSNNDTSEFGLFAYEVRRFAQRANLAFKRADVDARVALTRRRQVRQQQQQQEHGAVAASQASSSARDDSYLITSEALRDLVKRLSDSTDTLGVPGWLLKEAVKRSSNFRRALLILNQRMLQQPVTRRDGKTVVTHAKWKDEKQQQHDGIRARMQERLRRLADAAQQEQQQQLEFTDAPQAASFHGDDQRRADIEAKRVQRRASKQLRPTLLQLLHALAQRQLDHYDAHHQAVIADNLCPDQHRVSVMTLRVDPKSDDPHLLGNLQLRSHDPRLAKIWMTRILHRLSARGVFHALHPAIMGAVNGMSHQHALAHVVTALADAYSVRQDQLLFRSLFGKFDVVKAYPSLQRQQVMPALDNHARRAGIDINTDGEYRSIRALIDSWLTNRECRIELGAFRSSRRQMPQGVPAGSCLGDLCLAVVMSDVLYELDGVGSTPDSISRSIIRSRDKTGAPDISAEALVNDMFPLPKRAAGDVATGAQQDDSACAPRSSEQAQALHDQAQVHLETLITAATEAQDPSGRKDVDYGKENSLWELVELACGPVRTGARLDRGVQPWASRVVSADGVAAILSGPSDNVHLLHVSVSLSFFFPALLKRRGLDVKQQWHDISRTKSRGKTDRALLVVGPLGSGTQLNISVRPVRFLGLLIDRNLTFCAALREVEQDVRAAMWHEQSLLLRGRMADTARSVAAHAFARITVIWPALRHHSGAIKRLKALWAALQRLCQGNQVDVVVILDEICAAFVEWARSLPARCELVLRLFTLPPIFTALTTRCFLTLRHFAAMIDFGRSEPLGPRVFPRCTTHERCDGRNGSGGGACPNYVAYRNEQRVGIRDRITKEQDWLSRLRERKLYPLTYHAVTADMRELQKIIKKRDASGEDTLSEDERDKLRELEDAGAAVEMDGMDLRNQHDLYQYVGDDDGATMWLIVDGSKQDASSVTSAVGPAGAGAAFDLLRFSAGFASVSDIRTVQLHPICSAHSAKNAALEEGLCFLLNNLSEGELKALDCVVIVADAENVCRPLARATPTPSEMRDPQFRATRTLIDMLRRFCPVRFHMVLAHAAFKLYSDVAEAAGRAAAAEAPTTAQVKYITASDRIADLHQRLFGRATTAQRVNMDASMRT